MAYTTKLRHVAAPTMEEAELMLEALPWKVDLLNSFYGNGKFYITFTLHDHMELPSENKKTKEIKNGSSRTNRI